MIFVRRTKIGCRLSRTTNKKNSNLTSLRHMRFKSLMPKRLFMKYLRQLLIILGITFVGEVLNYYLPLPIPASIYGLALMLILLCTGVLKVSHVKETSQFLLDVMPLMFIPAAAGVVKEWGIIKPILAPTIIMITVVTVIVMAVTGLVTQWLINLRKKGAEKDV